MLVLIVLHPYSDTVLVHSLTLHAFQLSSPATQFRTLRNAREERYVQPNRRGVGEGGLRVGTAMRAKAGGRGRVTILTSLSPPLLLNFCNGCSFFLLAAAALVLLHRAMTLPIKKHF